jgi:threonine synthase
LRYVSTRGAAPRLDFEAVLLTGLARDGGLYVPETWPRLKPKTLAGFSGKPYAAVAAAVMAPFIGKAVPKAAFAKMVDDTYAGFRHQAVAPLVELGEGVWIEELFHGPTLAFKDIALQFLGLLFEFFLTRRERAITIVGATSGDTGSAAISACAGRARMRVAILHPHGRISEVQRRQMTTVVADNVHNVAIEGTFDDCQALLKAMFNDAAFRARLNLAAINSINWGRIMAQAVYYVTAALALGGPWRKVAFAVPTGNFGDVYAGYVAHKLGLPIAQLIVATNRNDILARFFERGTYSAGEVAPTMSPSMDIQVASNFERLLHDLYEGDGAEVARLLGAFAAHGRMDVSDDALGRAREMFDAARVDEEATAATMAEVLRSTGELVDPHTAVGIRAGRACRLDPRVPLVALATAHPAKFPEAVEKATGVRPALPDGLANLYERPERCAVLPNDLSAVQQHVQELVMETA